MTRHIAGDRSGPPGVRRATSSFPEYWTGMECEGTFYRMDNVPIGARSFCKPPFDFTESNEHTLKQLLNVVKQKKPKN